MKLKIKNELVIVIIEGKREKSKITPQSQLP